MKLPDNAAALINEARRKKSMNQEDFATSLGTRQSLISRYETGEIKCPPSDVIIRCANILLEGPHERRRERQLADQLLKLQQSGDTKVSEALLSLIEALASTPQKR